MKIKSRYACTLVFVSALVYLSFVPLPANFFAPNARAQEGAQRDRRATAPTPTPRVRTTPTPPPRAETVPTLRPRSAPVQITPTPTPVEIAPRVATAQTADELRARFREILQRPAYAPTLIGVKIVSLDTGRTLFEENAQKLVMPASNMKSFTVAAALDRLTPDFRFRTSVYAASAPDASGTLRGDVVLYGRGDPTIAAGLNGGDYYRGVNEIAARIAAAGVRRIEGNLVGDESYFTGAPYGFGWEWDDLKEYYGAEISALTVNDNALDLIVRPAANVGGNAFVALQPYAPNVAVINRVTTGARGSRRNINFARQPGNYNVIEVTGSVPLDDRTDKGYAGSVAVGRPALLFAQMLRVALIQKGVTITGQVRAVNAQEKFFAPADMTNWREIAFLESPPLSEIASYVLKPSQNLYAELVLRALGASVQYNSTANNLLPTTAPAAYSSVVTTAPNADNPASANANNQTPNNTTLTSSPATNQTVPLAPTTTNLVAFAPDERRQTVDYGTEAVQAFLQRAGVAPQTITMVDGSGLSRHDLITADATVQMLKFMRTHPYAQVFYDALPIAGVDGTLRSRFRGTRAVNNLRAKTGTINYVATLSGYVTSAAGERFVFSILVNNFPGDSGDRRQPIDEIGALLAAFNGKS